MWFGILPIVAYAGFLVTGAAWALAASFAPEIGGFACVVLLVAALHNCWEMTLIIIGRPLRRRKPRVAAFLRASAPRAYLNRAK